MENFSILHLSDLHLCDFSSNDAASEKGKTIKSRFDEKDKNYKDIFLNSLEKELERLKSDLKYIVISGDIGNLGSPKDYILAEKFLNELISKFKIKVEDLLIVPGNHDIHWGQCQVASEATDKIKPHMFHKEKFTYFSNFYNKFYLAVGREFLPEKSMFDHSIANESKLIFLLINSNFRESFQISDHVGHINYENLKQELEFLKDYSDYGKIAIFHHNPKEVKNERQSLENFSAIYPLFNKYNIHTFMFGHCHTGTAEGILKEEIENYIPVGSLAKIENFSQNAFGLLTCERENNQVISFKNRMYIYELTGNTWQELKGAIYLKDVIINKKLDKPLAKAKAVLNPFSANPAGRNKRPRVKIEKAKNKMEGGAKENESVFSEYLLDEVKRNKLLKSGHFHWGVGLGARSWIDTHQLLSRYDSLQLSIRAIISLIKEKEIHAEMIIGLGMEGNLLGALASIYLKINYSYIPVPNRREYNKYEEKVLFHPGSSVMLIVDVINDASTIKNLLEKKKDIFRGVKNILLVALFYTGLEEYRPGMFSHHDKRLTFFSVCERIKIDKCQNNPAQCLVNLENLDDVIEFYSKEE